MAGAWLDPAFGLRDNRKGTPRRSQEDNDMISDAMRALILTRCSEISTGELEALIEPDRPRTQWPMSWLGCSTSSTSSMSD